MRLIGLNVDAPDKRQGGTHMGISLPEVFLTQHAYIHTPRPHAESLTALKIASRAAKQ